LNYPSSVALDGSGNLLIADTYNNVVRRVDASSGIITTVVGNYNNGCSYPIGDGGAATSAALCLPSSVTVDASGNLFIGDAAYELIRRVDATSGNITTVAGNDLLLLNGFSGDNGPATSAQLNLSEIYDSLTSTAVDASGNLFIPDTYNNRVRRVDGKSGIINTFAGGGSGGDGGPAANGILADPDSLAVDSSGNLFVEETYGDRIRRVDAATGIISTVAGNGIIVCCSASGDVPATTTGLNLPFGLAVDSSGNLFISDWLVSLIRRVDAVTGIISTVAGGGTDGLGDGGPPTSASLSNPRGVAVGAAGNLFIGDTGNNRVRRVNAVADIITTVAGNGTGGYSGDGGLATEAELNSPRGVVVDRSGNLLIADFSNYRIRRVDAITGIITTVAGNGTNTYSGDGGPATRAGIGSVNEIKLDFLGNLFLSGSSSNQRVRRVDAFTGLITTVAGNGATGFGGDGGLATSAELDDPHGIVVDHSGNLFIGDGANNRVRKVPQPPFEAVSPTNVTFPTQVVGTRSTQVITLFNTGTAPLSISSLTIGGANGGDFAQTNYCGSSVASGEHCAILVTFAPTGVGRRTATLTIRDNAPDSPRTVPLSGTGCQGACLIARPL
jgi:sugar lactone lactonase YvrE